MKLNETQAAHYSSILHTVIKDTAAAVLAERDEFDELPLFAYIENLEKYLAYVLRREARVQPADSEPFLKKIAKQYLHVAYDDLRAVMAAEYGAFIAAKSLTPSKDSFLPLLYNNLFAKNFHEIYYVGEMLDTVRKEHRVDFKLDTTRKVVHVTMPTEESVISAAKEEVLALLEIVKKTPDPESSADEKKLMESKDELQKYLSAEHKGGSLLKLMLRDNAPAMAEYLEVLQGLFPALNFTASIQVDFDLSDKKIGKAVKSAKTESEVAALAKDEAKNGDDFPRRSKKELKKLLKTQGKPAKAKLGQSVSTK